MTHHQFSQIIVDGKGSALIANNGEEQLQCQGNYSETDNDLKYPEECAFLLPRHDYRHDGDAVYRASECVLHLSGRNFLKPTERTFSSAETPTDRFRAPFLDSDGSKVLPAPSNPLGTERLQSTVIIHRFLNDFAGSH